MTFDPKEARTLVERLDGYTPGPWVEFDGDICPANDIVNEVIATLYQETNDTDANLIAAAPDLHHALTAALDENERLRGIGWRQPVDTDEGTEMLVRSPQLVDEDFNPNGISAGTILPGDGDEKIAVCATWCNYQDHYHTTVLSHGMFLVRALTEGDTP